MTTNAARSSAVFHRKLDASLPMAVRGEGCYLVDDTGKRYLDASGGAAVSCLGHSDSRVIDAVCAQLHTLPAVHTSFFTNEPMEALATYLVERAPSGIARALFVNEGSVAVEAALKLARQYWLERGQPQRDTIISREASYHGNTLGALAIGGNLARRRPYAPMLFSNVLRIPACNEYRCRRPDETAVAYGRRAADELDTAIIAAGPGRVCAFVAEPVVGATAGCVTAAPGYFARIREICDRHDVLFIADEIMCGMGRTGSLFALEQEGIGADLITVAKGLGAGYQPIGAVLVHERIVDVIRAGSATLANGHTYMGHAACCAGALAVLRAIEDDQLLDNVIAMGARLRRLLHERLDAHPHVGDIRGRGLFLAVELVADRASRTPFDPALTLHARIKHEAQARGLLCYPSGGTADGVAGDHVLFAPAYIVTGEEIDAIVDISVAALAAALSSLPDRVAQHA
ncbi:MAG: aspartate aminotransferase family protein [Betaproteobacteria bacterium]